MANHRPFVISPWVAFLFKSIKIGSAAGIIAHFPIIKAILMRFFSPKDLMEQAQMNRRLTKEKVGKRKALGAHRPDFMQAMLKEDSKVVGNPRRYGNMQLAVTNTVR